MTTSTHVVAPAARAVYDVASQVVVQHLLLVREWTGRCHSNILQVSDVKWKSEHSDLPKVSFHHMLSWNISSSGRHDGGSSCHRLPRLPVYIARRTRHVLAISHLAIFESGIIRAEETCKTLIIDTRETLSYFRARLRLRLIDRVRNLVSNLRNIK